MGTRVKFKVVKNKMAPPFQIAEFDILFNEGISRTGAILDVATEMNIIDKKGSWFSYKGMRLGQGRDFVREELKKNPKLLDEIETIVLQQSKEAPLKKPSKALAEVEDDVLVEV